MSFQPFIFLFSTPYAVIRKNYRQMVEKLYVIEFKMRKFSQTQGKSGDNTLCIIEHFNEVVE